MEKTKIEYCDSTLSFVSGCLHRCSYCYARGRANRFRGCDESPDGSTDKVLVDLAEPLVKTYKNGQKSVSAYPYGFTPTFHRYRLNDLKKRKFGKTIFVCSTSDLFGKWVPDEWIASVFKACLESPEHRYLFLTKNPGRYVQLSEKGLLPGFDNFWYGSTVTDTEMPAFSAEEYHTFISVEPILTPFGVAANDNFQEGIDWMILGAETGNRKDKVVPKRDWVEEIVEMFHHYGKPVFMKNSMKPVWGDEILTELPWND